MYYNTEEILISSYFMTLLARSVAANVECSIKGLRIIRCTRGVHAYSYIPFLAAFPDQQRANFSLLHPVLDPQ